jgi:hypothetical protein
VASPLHRGIDAAQGMATMTGRSHTIHAFEDDEVIITWWSKPVPYPAQKLCVTHATCPPAATRDARRDTDADGTSDGRGRAQTGEQPRDGD